MVFWPYPSCRQCQLLSCCPGLQHCVICHVCYSVMVLKKLGDELMPEFHSVVEYLGAEQGMQVVVEPHEHEKMVRRLCGNVMQACLCLIHVLQSCCRFLAVTY